MVIVGSSPAAPSADNKLVRTTRVRRQTLAGGQAPPLSSENQTTREQPLVFNHVYNINVPLESLCSVDLDSAASAGPTDDDVYAPHQHPEAACGCPATATIQQLVTRVEMLEKKVSLLKAQCGSGCCSEGSAMGRVDFVPGCSGHGSFSFDLCGCICEEGWAGKNCSEPRCPDDCSGQGACVEGECVCDRDFGGENCSEPRCPSDCSGRGLCIDGECVCEESFTGEDCMVGRCLNDCSDQGTCVNSTCQCRPGYVGEDCSLVYCANNCRQEGAVQGRLLCLPGRLCRRRLQLRNNLTHLCEVATESDKLPFTGRLGFQAIPLPARSQTLRQAWNTTSMCLPSLTTASVSPPASPCRHVSTPLFVVLKKCPWENRKNTPPEMYLV
ncbi:unnamed protein product [Tetraodon nigroviridis]|uniref:(spotted green pufferfish) hypothetical protein n=1 Tax=Tetraodon nigroviridis TaxID=99883 RepID=Q4RVC8_TETNG|nr:unnamed protein product [Tetraodon nigroviridis]